MTETTTHKVIHATECLAAGTLTFLIQATRELARAGVRQVLIYSRRPDTPADVESLFDPRVELVEIAAPGHGFLRYCVALRRTLLWHLRGLEETSIHLHSSKAGFVGRLVLMGLRTRPPVYYSPHGLSFLNRRFVLPGLAFHSLEWLAAQVDCQLVGCSRSEAQLLGNLNRRPALVLENAVDDSWLRLDRRSAAPPLVVSMGRICYQKAPEVFAAMAARFQIAGVAARFVWIGSGDSKAEARLRAAGVEVTGWLQRGEVQQLMAQAAVYVQTSRWEGMPLSVLQALAAGVPCVVSNAVGNRDAVRQGWTGFVYNHVDEALVCIRRLLVDQDLNARFSQAAREDAWQRFSNASFRARLLQLYRIGPSARQWAELPPARPHAEGHTPAVKAKAAPTLTLVSEDRNRPMARRASNE